MIDQIFAIETFKIENMVAQQVRILSFIRFGVSHSLMGGEHFTILIAIGPIQFDTTFRYWNSSITEGEE